MHKIGCQHLHARAGPLADSQHALVEMVRSPVGQIIPCDRGNYDVFQSQPGRRFGNPLRLVAFQRPRPALVDRTEAARPSTSVAHDHEGGRFLRPAFAAIRTFGALTNRLQAQFGKQAGGGVMRESGWDLAAQPAGQPPPRGLSNLCA